MHVAIGRLLSLIVLANILTAVLVTVKGASAQDRVVTASVVARYCANRLLSVPKVAADLAVLNVTVGSVCDCFASIVVGALSQEEALTVAHGAALPERIQAAAPQVLRYCLALKMRP